MKRTLAIAAILIAAGCTTAAAPPDPPKFEVVLPESIGHIDIGLSVPDFANQNHVAAGDILTTDCNVENIVVEYRYGVATDNGIPSSPYTLPGEPGWVRYTKFDTSDPCTITVRAAP